MKTYYWGLKFTDYPAKFKDFGTARLYFKQYMIHIVSPLTVLRLSHFGFRTIFGITKNCHTALLALLLPLYFLNCWSLSK